MVPEQIEIDDMMKKRQSNSSQGRKLKKRGRKSKIAAKAEAATNLDEAVEFVPFGQSIIFILIKHLILQWKRNIIA